MDRAVDIFHPLASLEWRECRKVPVDIGRAQAVRLNDKVYIGGATVSGNIRDEARIYIYAPTTDTWDILDTPVYHFALTTYHSQLVLVGGWEYTSGLPTNKLWTLNKHDQWQEILPPLPTPLPAPGSSAVSHGDYLLVIGVDYPPSNNKVYAYNGHQWENAQHPPQLLYFITSAIFDGRWYLMGGELNLPQKTHVYSASLDSLIASCQLGEPLSIWKRLQNVSIGFCHPAVFGNVLIAVGGLFSTTISLCVYSSQFTQSWVHMADAPITLIVSTPCAVALSYNELMVISGCRVFKVMLKMTRFNPDSFFDRRGLYFLEEAGIPVMSHLNNYTQYIQNILGLPMTHNLDLINYWLSSVWQVSPTWNNLLDVIRLLNLDDLAQQIESYLSGATQNLSPIRETDGDREMDEQLRLRDDTISHLKQEMYAMQQRIRELESKIKELESHLSLKEEVEGKAVSLPVKIELNEEITSITKATAQPTTASWNLRGVEVSGEMTVVVHSSYYQQITWDGFGLKLHIQEGSLPAGMKQCTINIKASLAGQYEFPENSHLVSAIFWLHCETVHKFTRPITMEIQHCAKPRSDARVKLHFVRAVCSQKQLPYTFKQLPGGIFTSHCSYGIVELNGFSGVGITQEGSEDREYCSQLFYLGQPNSCQIHFVVTWNVEAHLTVVKEEYENSRALLGFRQVVEFESDAVSLNIPMEGITVGGWTITPLIRPVVTKKQVDNFIEGRVTPCCWLKAEFKGMEVSNLKHQVNIQGAKYPHNIFIIDLPAEDLMNPPPKKRSRVEPSGLDTKLTMASHFEVCSSSLKLLDDEQIQHVGEALGLRYNVLQRMDRCCFLDQMVAAWLRKEDNVRNDPTWRTLIEALRNEGQSGVAETIEEDKR